MFNCKFKDLFERKPSQIPPVSIRVQPDLRAVGFVRVVSSPLYFLQYMSMILLPTLSVLVMVVKLQANMLG